LRYRRIRDLREDHDYTQAFVAEKLGIGQRSYAYYESGERSLPPELLCALARLYHTSTDYILELTDEAGPYPRKKP